MRLGILLKYDRPRALNMLKPRLKKRAYITEHFLTEALIEQWRLGFDADVQTRRGRNAGNTNGVILRDGRTRQVMTANDWGAPRSAPFGHDIKVLILGDGAKTACTGRPTSAMGRNLVQPDRLVAETLLRLQLNLCR